jgi:hypothetical protein
VIRVSVVVQFIIYSGMFKVIRVLVVIALLGCVHVQAQENNLSNVFVSVQVRDMPLASVLTVIQQQVPYKFAFSTELIARQKNVTLDVQNKPLDEVIQQVLKGTSIGYSIIDNQIVLQEISKPARITLSGYIKDSLSGESLPQAIIYLPDNKFYTYTNNYGFFSITQNKADSLDIVISYVGYNILNKKVSGAGNSIINFYLSENKIQINSAVIKKNNADDNIKKDPPGRTNISMDMVKAMPSINGTGDILSTIQMMPGVLSGLDGRPGYFIRGGNTDQNLVQLDDATLYNPNHLLGLVGIFNSSAIKSAYLLKAGFPASFGDHLSSVLDVTMKDGNDQHVEGDLQLGTLTSAFTLSGPIISKKSSFFFTARRSSIDLFMEPFKMSNYYSNYSFYDLNAKFNFQLSQKDRLYLSFYQGRDNSSYSKDSTLRYGINYKLDYGNQAVALRWNHLFSQKVFSNTSVIYNNYYHDVTATQKPYYAELYSGIKDIDIKSDFSYYPSMNHKISAGVNFLHQILSPATVLDKSLASDTSTAIIPSEIKQKYSNRIAFYFGDEFWLTPKFNLYLGARVPLFLTGEVHYLQFEPRLALMRILNSSSSIKISYTQMHQFLNLVQSFNAAFPAQIWIGSDKTVKPQNCQELSIGFFKNFRQNMFQFSVEMYYKQMGNQVMFKEGPTPDINSNLDNFLVFGKGQSYGTEFYLGKNAGKLTGWLAYTLSYSKQQFDSLNLGKEFPFAYDRRHSVYLSVGYEINTHWQISANFLYASGNAFSLFREVARNPYNPLYYNNVNGNGTASGNTDNKIQNNYRLEPYNRLDLGVRYRWEGKLFNHNIKSEFVFSVYNVYAHKNTFFAYCSLDPETRQPIPVQISFIPVIPAISYYLKF